MSVNFKEVGFIYGLGVDVHEKGFCRMFKT